MNVEQIQIELRNQKLDGWLFFDHHQRDPLAYRVLGFTPARHVTRRWYYLIPAEGEPAGLTHNVESDMLNALPGTKARYSRWQDQISGLRALLGGRRRIAMQYSPQCAIPYVSLVDGGTLELIRGLGVEIVSSADLIQYFEARWNQESLDSHLQAGRRVDRIRSEAFQMIGARLGNGQAVSEYEVNRFVRMEFERAGLLCTDGPIVGVNGNASNPHYEPTAERNSPIRPGDFVLIDMWAKLNQPRSVYYDITWTGVCGAPTDEMRNVFTVVRDARDRAVKRVMDAIASKQELRGFEVDDAARGYIREKGFDPYFVHRTGHSIGEDVHGTGANMDNLETHDDRKVIAWTCFSVEPGVYLPAFGVRSEVNVFVGDEAARVTGEVQQDLVKICG
ncbi:MAG TPA: M24 family metallopeptidase [Bryobacteraceae bacterium]|jgi:Xaa-Pro aminopeptidase|nr:M24 family metallopeptidase [Bryobacteraceae bacterium]